MRGGWGALVVDLRYRLGYWLGEAGRGDVVEKIVDGELHWVEFKPLFDCIASLLEVWRRVVEKDGGRCS